MSKNIVFEGWLTKSPPNRRIWRTRWRRRWFALRQSGELPGQYFLDYYADRNCRRLKGTINLDLCEQVDAGLHMERNGNAPSDPKIRGSVFTIQTQHRTYHLEADCESEMEKWVDAICRVCGLRSTEETIRRRVFDNNFDEPQAGPSSRPDTYQNSLTTMSAMNEHYECADGTGPYIPISECITGVRAQDEQRAFTFDPKNIVMSTRNDGHQMYTSQPHIRLNNQEFSENESNVSDDEEGSLHASHQNIPDWSVTKSFTKLSVSPRGAGASEDGPPVPPRPPKTFATRSREVPQKDPFQGPKIQEPAEAHDSHGRLRVPRRMSQGAPSSPGRLLIPVLRQTDDEEEISPGPVSMQYINLPTLPPAVDRALKPRYSSHSIGHINAIMTQELRKPQAGRSDISRSVSRAPAKLSIFKPAPSGHGHGDELKPDALQYLDLDLHTSKPPQSKGPELRTKVSIAHGKSMSAVDSDSAYKTVDFLKTEAFNITRQDAEASRSFQY